MVKKNVDSSNKEVKMQVPTKFRRDFSGEVGKASGFFRPKNFQELKDFIIKNPQICIRGGGSGLVGGCVPQREVVLDMAGLDRIVSFDVGRMSVEVEAGVRLADLKNYLLPIGYEVPMFVCSEKSATIGGLIATNSPGIRSMKYGRFSEWINWIEIINSHGEVERKSRVDLSDYAGLEGITGVISKASLKIIKRIERSASVLVFDYVHDLVDKVKELRKNRNVCAIELIDKRVSEYLLLPFSYHLIVEYDSLEGEKKDAEYFQTMELLYLAYNVMLNREKNYRIEDFKVFLDDFDRVFTYIESYDIPIFASISTGILHPCFSEEKINLIQEIIRIVRRFGGKINPSFGIGLLKKEFVDVKDKQIIHSIKKRLDSLNKFNSGKTIDG